MTDQAGDRFVCGKCMAAGDDPRTCTSCGHYEVFDLEKVADRQYIEAIRAMHPSLVARVRAWLGEQLGVSVPVEPQRGQIVHLQMDDHAATATWPVASSTGG